VLTGGHLRSSVPQRWALRWCVFTVGALAAGSACYGALGLVGAWLLRGVGSSVLAACLITAGGYAVASVVPRTRYLFKSGRQIRRSVAYAGIPGAFAYGTVMGIGLLTVTSSPLVVVGSIVCMLDGAAFGSWWWGVVYGCGFAIGRVCGVGLLARRLDGEPGPILRRAIKAQLRSVRLGTAVAGLWIISAGASVLVSR
jgi:hypothetical protein